MINKSNKGSVLLLTLMVSFLLSLIIAAGLTQRQTSMVSNNAFKQSNRALYLTMRGLHNGMELLRLNYNAPHTVEFNHSDFTHDDIKPNEFYRSAPLWDSPANPDPQFTVQAFTRYNPPHLSGMDISSKRDRKLYPFQLYVSSAIKTGEVEGNPVFTRRGIEVVVYILSPQSQQ